MTKYGLISILLASMTITPMAMAAVIPLNGFTTEGRMDQAIMAGITSPHQTYLIIQRAHQLRLVPQAAVVYRDTLARNPDNPYLLSAYSYAWYLAAGDFSYGIKQYNESPIVRELRAHEADVLEYEQKALTEAPNSPEVLLECGQVSSHLVASGVGDRQRGYVALRKATQLRPHWAEAFFQLGDVTNLFAAALYGKGKVSEATLEDLGRQQLSAYEQAERLQPTLHTECLLGKAYAYQWLKKYKAEKACLDAYIKLKPEFAAAPNIKHWVDLVNTDAAHSAS